jgi:hypothetical protein
MTRLCLLHHEIHQATSCLILYVTTPLFIFSLQIHQFYYVNLKSWLTKIKLLPELNMALNHLEWTMNLQGSVLVCVHWQLTSLKKMGVFCSFLSNQNASNMSSDYLFQASVRFATSIKLRSKSTSDRTLIILPTVKEGWFPQLILGQNLISNLILF